MSNARARAPLVILLVAVTTFYAVFIARTAFRAGGLPFFTLIDDAMISMRYAQHLADGRGLVWNIGEAPIEGFTNPGWMLVMSLPHLARFPQNSISLVVMIISAAILAANAVVIHEICARLLPAARAAPLLAATVTAFYFPLVFWSLRGMEVGLLVLVIDLAVLASLQPTLDSPRTAAALGLLLAMAVLIRLDALVQVSAILGYVILFRRSHRRATWLALAIVALAVIAILALQRAYFGDLLPNTYFLKMSGGDLDQRLKHGLLVFVQYASRDVVAPALVVTAGLLRFRQMRSPETLLLIALFAGQCLYSVWVGGDYAEPEVASANRFITQGVPALIILFAVVVEHGLAGRAGNNGTHRALLTAGLVALTAVVAMSGLPWYRWAQDNAPLLRADIRRVRAGLAIGANTSPDAVIAAHAAGQIPYYSQRTTIDLLGLNDRVIARGPRRTSFYPGHDKWNYEYSIGQRLPDLIADNWLRLPDYIRQQSNYRKLKNGMYVRTDTTVVNEIGLMQAFP